MPAARTGLDTRIVELVLPFPPRELSPNARAGQWDKIKAVKDYRYACKVEALKVRNVAPAGSFPLAVPVQAHITFVVRTNRSRDEDNLMASMKAGIDGIVDARVLAGDDARLLNWRTCKIIMGDKAEVRLRLEAGG